MPFLVEARRVNWETGWKEHDDQCAGKEGWINEWMDRYSRGKGTTKDFAINLLDVALPFGAIIGIPHLDF